MNAPTAKQTSFALRLANERLAPWLGDSAEARVATMTERVSDSRITGRLVSSEIERLLGQPRDTSAQGTEPQVDPGVYELPGTGEIFVVKKTRDKERVYAKRLIELKASSHLNVKDDGVKIEFVYAPGAIQRIKPEYKMPKDRAEELTIRYGRCIACGRTLKAAQSVRQGIGPVCIKNFA